jgi:uncharacterized protein (TIGR03435 family)
MRPGLRAGTKTVFVFVVLALSAGLHSQTQVPRLTFDVAAIHPAQPGSDRGIIKPLPAGNGYTVENMSVKTMMSVIYRIPSRQITGGPDWFNTATFDVDAKVDGTYSIDDLHTMFKNLLADRFGLKFHTAKKEGAVYALVVDKSGMKMTPDGSAGGLEIPIVRQTPSKWVGTKVPMEYLCWFIGQQMRSDPRPVIDKTGLTQVYSFTLTFAPELPPGLTREDLLPELQDMPTISDAVRGQLGLRLEPAKGLVDNYVIDHLEQPSAN